MLHEKKWDPETDFKGYLCFAKIYEDVANAIKMEARKMMSPFGQVVDMPWKRICLESMEALLLM